jgi:hypothetical protein
MESPIYAPYSHDLSILSNPRWHKILTWNRTVCLPNVNYYDIPIADGIPLDINPNLSAVSQKGVAIANPAKSQQGFLPQRDALYLELAARQLIDLYGNHWSYMPDRGLHGSTPDKIATITNYSYSLVIENCLCPGYVTEKLSDSILANRPVIYYGDYEIAQSRFSDTFVKLENLSIEAFLKAESQISKSYLRLSKSVKNIYLKSYYWSNSFLQKIIVAVQIINQ